METFNKIVDMISLGALALLILGAIFAAGYRKGFERGHKIGHELGRMFGALDAVGYRRVPARRDPSNETDSTPGEPVKEGRSGIGPYL